MKKFIGLILWAILIILILAVLAGLTFWVVWIKHWPWWFAAALIAGILGLWIGFIFFRKYFIRSKEQAFVQRVIEQDSAAIERVPISQRHELLELQEHWKESVKRLQNSSLRKKGNPLYVLPWYLIMGESRAGKTSAIRNVRESSPMTEVSRSAGLSSTRNCDWWFFDQAILLDTAGRYTIPIDEGTDLEEWKQFLVLLSTYRKKEPLNGVIIGIAADKLLAADEKQLRDEGQSIRQRIDQMMRTMGAKFPVYVLVTKMDLVHGFTEFNQQLPEGSVAQVMGYTNTSSKMYWKDIMEEAIASISASLKDLRFLLVHKTTNPSPGAILFPNEFKYLLPGMQKFLEAVFEENPYQETPLLRGLYFSSALKEGMATSEFLRLTGSTPEKIVNADRDGGYFLKHFFTRILPKDRNLFKPIQEFVSWRRVTRSLGLMSWLLIWLATCGLLGLSFYHNRSTIIGFTEDFYTPPKLTKDQAADFLILDKMRLEIIEMHQANKRWKLPSFGLQHAIKVENRLKKEYLQLFKEGILTSLDTRLAQSLNQYNENPSEDAFVDYVGYVVARINVLKEHMAGKRLTGSDAFKVITTNLLVTRNKRLQPEIAAKFGDIYYAYQSWKKGRVDDRERLETFRRILMELLSKRGRDLRWMVRKRIPTVPNIQLMEFWGTSDLGTAPGGVFVSGAYTAGGRNHIESFMEVIEKVFDDSDIRPGSKKGAFESPTLNSAQQTRMIFEKNKKEFWTWYRKQFFNAWYAFITQFDEGMQGIRTVSDWERMVTLMATDDNPYFQLLETVADEISRLKPGTDAPLWANMIVRVNGIRKLAKQKKVKSQSIAAKIIEKKEQVETALGKRIDEQKARELEDKLEQARAWNDYSGMIEKIQLGESSIKQTYDIYSGTFTFQDQSSKDMSAFDVAYKNYYRLKTLMTERTNYPAVWDLIFGPQNFMMTYAADATACYVQQQWEEEVLGVLQAADPERTAKILFDKSDGVVWKFLNNTAKPFIGRNRDGYFVRRNFRKRALPFTKEFIHLLNRGTQAVMDYEPQYTVTMRTLPLSANEGAKVKPYSGILTVNCADSSTRLENYNYPRTRTFNWTPGKCGDVLLTISFPNFTLQRRYKGKMGFPTFLEDFRDGSYTFSSDDFPEHKDNLERIGVSSIIIAYRITGSEPVRRLLKRAPTSVPTTIIACKMPSQ